MAQITANGKQALDNLLLKAVEEKKIPAGVFAVTNLDGEIYTGAAGTTILDDPTSRQVDADTNFWICSQTKLITSIAVLQLVDKGEIYLDSPVERILPEMGNPVVLDNPLSEHSTYKAAKTPIKLLHLLNHSSGLSYYTNVKHGTAKGGMAGPYDTDLYENVDPITRFFELCKGDYPGVPLSFEPGTNFAYGFSSDLLGFIVERITGKTLEEYCKENIFTPLGMKTSFYLTPKMKENSLNLAFRESNGKIVPFTNQIVVGSREMGKVRIHLGGVGMISSMRDYLTLLRHLLQIHAKCAKNPILYGDTVQDLLCSRTLTENGSKSLNAWKVTTDSQFTIGLCANTTDWPGKRPKGSVCWSGWAGTQYFLDPLNNIAVVYGTQLIPTRDPEVLSLWGKLEETLYKGLEVSKNT